MNKTAIKSLKKDFGISEEEIKAVEDLGLVKIASGRFVTSREKTLVVVAVAFMRRPAHPKKIREIVASLQA